MSIVMSIDRNTFFLAFYAIFLPFLANANKNFEEKLKYSLKKCWENLHCLCIVRILGSQPQK